MIRDINESLFASFRKTSWADDVHNSYEKYIKQCEMFSSKLSNYASLFKQIENDLEPLIDSSEIANELKKYEMELASI